MTDEEWVPKGIDISQPSVARVYDYVHEVAQEVDPGARVVYVDNDPIVLAHARALLADNNNTTVIKSDIRRPDEILNSSAGRRGGRCRHCAVATRRRPG